MVIEALVAVLIVAVMAGLWFETSGSAARRAVAINDRRTAMLVAQSQLATVGVTVPARFGSVDGRDGAYLWQIGQQPYDDAGPGVSLVTVTVAAPGRGRLATLQTLRFGR